MDVDKFEDYLERFGEDLSQWPPAEKSAGLALLAQSDAARSLLREAELLRKALSGSPVRAPVDLTDRIMLQASRRGAAPTTAAAPQIQSAPAVHETHLVSKTDTLLERIILWLAGTGGGLRFAFLSLCFVIGMFVGLFHGITTLDLREVDFHDFMASVIDAHYVRD